MAADGPEHYWQSPEWPLKQQESAWNLSWCRERKNCRKKLQRHHQPDGPEHCCQSPEWPRNSGKRRVNLLQDTGREKMLAKKCSVIIAQMAPKCCSSWTSAHPSLPRHWWRSKGNVKVLEKAKTNTKTKTNTNTKIDTNTSTTNVSPSSPLDKWSTQGNMKVIIRCTSEFINHAPIFASIIDPTHYIFWFSFIRPTLVGSDRQSQSKKCQLAKQMPLLIPSATCHTSRL